MASLHFLYHELRPTKSRYSYVIPCEEFVSHCELFARLTKAAEKAHLCPKVTFDDGNASDLLYAAPTLDRFGLRATFFITAGWTGTRAGFMDWPELRELRAGGHRIGAHGMTHKLLTTCTARELKTELSGARRRLEDGLGAEVRLMSLPGGRANGRVLRACHEAGFHQIFTSVPRPERMDRTPRTVGRLNLHAGTAVATLEKVLDPRTGVLNRMTRVSQIKAAAQHMLGDRLYAALWAIGNRKEPEGADLESPAA